MAGLVSFNDGSRVKVFAFISKTRGTYIDTSRVKTVNISCSAFFKQVSLNPKLIGPEALTKWTS